MAKIKELIANQKKYAALVKKEKMPVPSVRLGEELEKEIKKPSTYLSKIKGHGQVEQFDSRLISYAATKTAVVDIHSPRSDLLKNLSTDTAYVKNIFEKPPKETDTEKRLKAGGLYTKRTD